MAARLLRRERGGHTLQRTALAHEAFLRLFGRIPGPEVSVESFLTSAARQMRQILIDHSRKRHAQKRGGAAVRVPFTDADQGMSRDEDSVLALDQALRKLEALDPRAHAVVELKFFCGFTNEEAARILGVSDGTVESNWQFARSWLFGVLADKRRCSRL